MGTHGITIRSIPLGSGICPSRPVEGNQSERETSMAKTTEKRFKLMKWADYWRGPPLQFLQVDSRRIRECMRYYREAKLDGIYISPCHGYKLKDLSFLKDYPFITRVAVAYSSSIRVSDLCVLKTLRSINIANNQQPIDFSAFPELENVSVHWHPKMTLPERSTTWKRLEMTGYRPKSKDLSELPDLVNLERLQIVRAPLQSLAGLKRFRRIKWLGLFYLSKLERIADLDAPSLEVLEFDVCRKICDHAHVATLPRVRVLRLNDCGQVPSLTFLDRMHALEEFAFVDTNVLDGDMRPCFRLKYAGFLNKKHYSHTCEEVEAIIAARQRKGKPNK